MWQGYLILMGLFNDMEVLDYGLLRVLLVLCNNMELVLLHVYIFEVLSTVNL